MIKELEAKPLNKWWAFCFAAIYSRSGDQDKTFEYLELAKEETWYPWIRVVDWISDETKKDPRFLEIMEELNLPPPEPFKYNPEA